MSPCHCNSAQSFADCCETYVAGKQKAPSPEALMRSRYSAFVLGAVDYLLQTSATENHAPNERALLEQSCANTHWLALKVIEAKENTVEFAAFYEGESKVEQLHERSTFELRDDQWVYVSGVFLPPLTFGRNDPCWCGSGKKSKKCHAD